VNKSGPSDTARSPISDRSPMASLSKASVCDRSLAGIAGSNAARDIAVCLMCCVLPGSGGLCVELITRPEESYQVLSSATIATTSTSR
jgi:hypothetical protein